MLVNLLVGVLVLGLSELVPNGKRKLYFYPKSRNCNFSFLLVNSLECISCSSASLAACATLQLTSGSLPSTTCTEGVESCYTYVQGGLLIY